MDRALAGAPAVVADRRLARPPGPDRPRVPRRDGLLARPRRSGWPATGSTTSSVGYPTVHPTRCASWPMPSRRAAVTVMVDSRGRSTTSTALAAGPPGSGCAIDVDASLRLGRCTSASGAPRCTPPSRPRTLARRSTARRLRLRRRDVLRRADRRAAGLLAGRAAGQEARRRPSCCDAGRGVVAAVRERTRSSRSSTAAAPAVSTSPARDPAITELAAGSGLYGPTLFDGYDDFRPATGGVLRPAVVRRPAPGIATAVRRRLHRVGPAGQDPAADAGLAATDSSWSAPRAPARCRRRSGGAAPATCSIGDRVVVPARQGRGDVRAVRRAAPGAAATSSSRPCRPTAERGRTSDDATWTNWAGSRDPGPGDAVEHPASRPPTVVGGCSPRRAGTGCRSRRSAPATRSPRIAATDGVQLRLDRLTRLVARRPRRPAGSRCRPASRCTTSTRAARRSGWRCPTSVTSTRSRSPGRSRPAPTAPAPAAGHRRRGRGADLVTGRRRRCCECSAEREPEVFGRRPGGPRRARRHHRGRRCSACRRSCCTPRSPCRSRVLDARRRAVDAHDHFEFYWFPHTDRVLIKRNDRRRRRHRRKPLAAWRRLARRRAPRPTGSSRLTNRVGDPLAGAGPRHQPVAAAAAGRPRVHRRLVAGVRLAAAGALPRERVRGAARRRRRRRRRAASWLDAARR